MDPTLEYLYNHVFLPKRVPGCSDASSKPGDQALIDLLRRSALACQDLCLEIHQDGWIEICQTLDRFVNLHTSNRTLSSASAQEAIHSLPPGQTLILYLKLQNSALLIKREENSFLIESFETSPPAARVLAAQTALRWDFPSRAVKVPETDFLEASFLANLTDFLEKTSVESIKEFAATTLKAGSFAYESRDTTEPALIGEFLMAILYAKGHRAKVLSTPKRIYDEICWAEGSENPWRRSPLWLVLRVGLQRTLSTTFGGTVGQFYYKVMMCMAFVHLCKHLVNGSNSLEVLSFARTRLGRRTAKLQLWKKSGSLDHACSHILAGCEAEYQRTLQSLNENLHRLWNSIQGKVTKEIRPLMRRANPESTELSLVHCRATLFGIMDEVSFNKPFEPPRLEHRYRRNLQPSTWATRKFEEAKSLSDFMDLAQVEDDFQLVIGHSRRNPSEETCIELLKHMRGYLDVSRAAYRLDPVQSSMMLLLLLEAWQALDVCALELYPLLAGYDHGFPPDLLYVLQIAQLADMERLQRVEFYMRDRTSRASKASSSIFGDLTVHSFQVQFYDDCDTMQVYMMRIHEINESRLAQKHTAWEIASQEYSRLVEQALRTPCLYTEDEDHPLMRVHDDKRCRKCYLNRTANRISIDTYENLLPSDEIQAKALVFELCLPRGFAAWRDATWLMFRLGRVETPSGQGTMLRLGQIPGISEFLKTPESTYTIGLASSRKPFRTTHYANIKLPVAFDKICHPHGPRYRLLDSQQRCWTSQAAIRVSLAEICHSPFPKNTVYSSLRKYVHPSFEEADVSPNIVLASQTRCPNTLSVVEFMAFQGIRLGHHVQWIQLLRELCSTNLNFGTVEVCALVVRLALQVGPPRGDNILRASHWVFEDSSFIDILISQIRIRMEAVATNWRESQTLECLMAIMERLWYLCGAKALQPKIKSVLLDARKVAQTWIQLLRREANNTSDVETMSRRSQDAFHAALLCRRTFVCELAAPDERMHADALTCFLECAFTLKDNLPMRNTDDIFQLKLTLRRLYIRDLKMLRILERTLRSSIDYDQASVSRAVNNIVGGTESSSMFTKWTFLPEPHNDWVTAHSAGDQGLSTQEIHFDIIVGSLLVNGEPVGRLPETFSNQSFFSRFFGQRVFRTYRSPLPNLSYRFASTFEGHEVHFGNRNQSPFMRVRTADHRIMEYVPTETFFPAGRADVVPDLPWPLLDDHVHWLDISSRSLIIRPFESMWRAKDSDWVLDLVSLQAWRRKKTLLVDPRSRTFSAVARILEPFENVRGMMIFQPIRSNLRLKLTKLELSFRVNAEGLLECDELKSIIDANQDAGTLYGMKSSLVLRDVLNPEKRSILIAIGTPNIAQQWGHSTVVIQHEGYYARYYINDVLGRLECPCEPRLLYFKAYCHAVTTSSMPDPLTKRTGVEEAVQCLRAGNAQPWAPLDETALKMLRSTADLTPRRVYYPDNIKVLQKVSWTNDLSTYAQDEDLLPAVNAIVEQCSVLEDFHQKGSKPPAIELGGDQHLLERSRLRNLRFRPNRGGQDSISGSDQDFTGRDCADSGRMHNAIEAALLVNKWAECYCSVREVTMLLQTVPVIQGFDVEFETHLLSDLIKTDPLASWGALFTLCRSTAKGGKHRLMFLFAFLAFADRTKMAVTRTLIMVAISQSVKADPLPQISTVHHFRAGERLTQEMIVTMCDQFRFPYVTDDTVDTTGYINPSYIMGQRPRRELASAKTNHERRSKQSCETFARHLLQQWPTKEPTLQGLEPLPLFQTEAALTFIIEEWSRVCNNHQFSQHLGRLQNLLASCEQLGDSFSDPMVETARDYPAVPRIKLILPSAIDLRREAPQAVRLVNHDVLLSCTDMMQTGIVEGLEHLKPVIFESNSISNAHQVPTSTSQHVEAHLHDIIAQLKKHASGSRLPYSIDLKRSLDAFGRFKSCQQDSMSDSDVRLDTLQLRSRISLFRSAAVLQFEKVCNLLEMNKDELRNGGLLPALTPINILELFCHDDPYGWKSRVQQELSSFGSIIRSLQRLFRISTAFNRNDQTRLKDEMHEDEQSESMSGQNIDWFLLEIDFDFRIRKDQYMVAQAMIAPIEGNNFVLQMNMGQGKSSVVIPMIVAQLANKRNLTRVIVPRPLLQQTAQLLQGRLGGLLGRKVKHFPFSRKSSTAIARIETYFKAHTDICRSRGIILTLPEHTLSFKLSGLQELSNRHFNQAAYMMQVQAWFDRRCKDVLDESDHMLAVKTQLIYPSGAQSPVDGHPSRWTVVQELLKLSVSLVYQLRIDFPKNVEVVKRMPGTFPTIYLLNSVVRDAFIDRLTDSILNGGAGLLPIENFAATELEAIKRFLCDARISKDIVSEVTGAVQRADARNEMLILRGLVVHRILLLGLSKRWNVQYGIHPGRDPIAVPFRSKGIPSDQAEFGHPDVSIVLTCLSFYYSGLNFHQFRQTLAHLLRSDEPLREFETWHQEVRTFPDSLRAWRSINIEDEVQTTELFKLLRLQMPAINYFLNQFVFPRHAKTFERKLVTSAWDIAMPKTQSIKPGATKSMMDNDLYRPLTVGFSGTNDNKVLLPLNVLQNDLPGLSHTNAEVLTYLLQSRNRTCIRAADPSGKRLSETSFLRMLKDHDIRMLLDAGAQILEFDNRSLVQAWLTVDTEALAGVYFDQDGWARVSFRDGKSQPLSVSPFLDNLDQCVVYLDEAHTRGVDLKMPVNAKAALTLGIMQTKDHTVQGKPCPLPCGYSGVL